MKVNHKKIIGREFLILVALAAVFGLTFLGLFIYDQINRSRSNEVYQQKMHVQEQLISIDNLNLDSERLQNQMRRTELDYINSTILAGLQNNQTILEECQIQRTGQHRRITTDTQRKPNQQ